MLLNKRFQDQRTGEREKATTLAKRTSSSYNSCKLRMSFFDLGYIGVKNDFPTVKSVLPSI